MNLGQSYRVNKSVDAQKVKMNAHMTNGVVPTYADWTSIPSSETIKSLDQESRGKVVVEWNARRYLVSKSDLKNNCSLV